MLTLNVLTVYHMFDGGIVCQYATKLTSWANFYHEIKQEIHHFLCGLGWPASDSPKQYNSAC